MKFLINFWPPVREDWGQLLENVSQTHKITRTIHYEYTGDDWKSFIIEFYRHCYEEYEYDRHPNIAKMIPKADYMESFSREILLVEVEIENPDFQIYKNNNPYGVPELKEIKERIRKKYIDKVPRFSIVHSFDTPVRNENIKGFLDENCEIIETFTNSFLLED